MATGATATTSLEDSLPYMIMAARQVREQKGGMPQRVTRKTLGKNVGRTWNEITLAALTASKIGETEETDNAQEITDTVFSITPTYSTIQVLITDAVKDIVSRETLAQTGSLGQNAIQRLKNLDGLLILSAASLTFGSTTVVNNAGLISAAATRITSNTTEPSTGPIYAEFHGFQIRSLYNEGVGGYGTYPIGAGMTADMFAKGFRGPIDNVEIYENGDVTITSNAATGGVYAKEGIVLVEGEVLEREVERRPRYGAGANCIILRDSYAYGERSSGHWVAAVSSDATSPTS